MRELGIDVVGIGADGLDSLRPPQRLLVDRAEVVIGGARHLAMLDPTPGREQLPWPSPLRAGLPALLERIGDRRAVVLASGDPLVSGIGTTLIGMLGADRVRIHPAVSSVAYARARMGWSAEESVVITVVGRDPDRVRRDLGPGEKLIVLSTGGQTPAELAAMLTTDGYGASVLTVLADLDTPAESRTEARADAWSAREVPALNIVCIDCRLDARVPLGTAPGLPDAAFDHDGQLTKRHVRASALAMLRPGPGVLWDIGAGAGSICIEWCRTHPRALAYGIERNPDRARRAEANARRLGVGHQVRIVDADAADPTALRDLPTPDAVFVGGGATSGVIERCWAALRPGGRIVVHAVTVETELLLHDLHARHGGELTRIGVETLDPIGRYHGWRPARPVVQWYATPTTNPNQETS